MLINNQDLMSEFYEMIKETYPELSYEQCKKVLFSPWRFLKREMESGELPIIRFQYFGSFRVFKGRANYMRWVNEERFKKGLASEEDYKLVDEMLENYLKKVEDEKI